MFVIYFIYINNNYNIKFINLALQIQSPFIFTHLIKRY